MRLGRQASAFVSCVGFAEGAGARERLALQGRVELSHAALSAWAPTVPIAPGSVAARQDRGEVGAVTQRAAHSQAPLAAGARHGTGPGILHGPKEVGRVVVGVGRQERHRCMQVYQQT